VLLRSAAKERPPVTTPPVIIPNTTAAQHPPPPPRRGDGMAYRYELLYDGATRRAYADTVTELLAALIPDYLAVSDDETRLTRRIVHAVHTQVALQAALVADLGLRGCHDDDTKVLLAPRDTPPALTVWAAPVPLVLVTSFYQPAGPLPRPRATAPPGGRVGRLLWLDPDSEARYLRSLHDAGVVHLHELARASSAPA
jgi:hypothetical protein